VDGHDVERILCLDVGDEDAGVEDDQRHSSRSWSRYPGG
jgi:hypothetical protein